MSGEAALRWALVRDGAVFTYVEQPDEPALDGFIAVPLEAGSTVSVGHTWDGSQWGEPAQAQPRHITQLAFEQRFEDSEAIAIDLASLGATVEAATVRRYLSLVKAAKYIDLDHPKTRVGVQALEAAGLLAAGRAAEILDAPVQANERP